MNYEVEPNGEHRTQVGIDSSNGCGQMVWEFQGDRRTASTSIGEVPGHEAAHRKFLERSHKLRDRAALEERITVDPQTHLLGIVSAVHHLRSDGIPGINHAEAGRHDPKETEPIVVVGEGVFCFVGEGAVASGETSENMQMRFLSVVESAGK